MENKNLLDGFQDIGPDGNRAIDICYQSTSDTKVVGSVTLDKSSFNRFYVYGIYWNEGCL